MTASVLIVGAGPYGMALAFELQSRGLSVACVGIPFDLWHEHTFDNMHIRSDRHASEIVSRDRRFDLTKFITENYPDRQEAILRDRLPVDVFRHYLRWVTDQVDFPLVNGLVTHLHHTGDEFEAATDSGETIRAKAVVLATGIGAHRYVPKSLGHLPHEFWQHTYEAARSLEGDGKRVLVIGTGQSAAEAIAHLSSETEITWVQRRKPVFYSEPLNMPAPLFRLVVGASAMMVYLPAMLRSRLGRKFVKTTITPDLREFVEAHHVHAFPGDVRHLNLVPDTGRLTSETLDRSFDRVIAATGYRYNFDNLNFVDPELAAQVTRRARVANLSRRFETSVRNLFVVGGLAEPIVGPSQRFIMGSQHAVSTVGGTLVKRLG